MRYTYAFILIVLCLRCFPQVVTHGPIVGAVTDSSCRVFVRTNLACNVTVQLSTNAGFSSIDASSTVATNASKDTIAIADISGLTANTKYYARLVIGGNPSGGTSSFETFLSAGTAGHQVFISGSCIYSLTDSGSALFDRAELDHPKAFIQCGDWGYPDASTGTQDLYLTSPPTSFAVNYNNIRTFYKLRYQSPSHIGFVKSQAMDYLYDDHDFLNDNCAKDAASGFDISLTGNIGAPVVISQPAQGRLNSIKGYLEWFPGYHVADSTEGIYHSFRSGNIEFFVPDLRAMRTPQAAAIKQTGNQWVYSPPAGYSLLGANQMNWLKNALLNSTATWKIIISSVAFNVAYRMSYDTCLKIGGGNVPYWAPSLSGIQLPNYGYTAVLNFADNWNGFRGDQDSLMQFIFTHNIKNVFVVSGDSHTVGLDDGVNSGLPELNSGNLKKANSQDWLITQQFMGYGVWDKGGSGLCDANNFNETFSRIETFGSDSLRLSAMDASGSEVCAWTFMPNEAYRYNPQYHANRIPVAVSDVANINPNDTATIAVTNNDSDMEQDQLFVNLRTNPQNGAAIVNNDNSITYIPSQNFSGIDTFRYTLCDHANPSCYNCSNALVTVNVGVNSIMETSTGFIQLYPNPTSEALFIRSSSAQNMETEILNMLGQPVLRQKLTGSGRIDISSLAPANYIVSIYITGTHEMKRVKVSIVK